MDHFQWRLTATLKAPSLWACTKRENSRGAAAMLAADGAAIVNAMSLLVEFVDEKKIYFVDGEICRMF